MRSLRCKLIISIAALLLLSTGTLSVVFNYSIEGIFEKYAYYQREQKVKQIIEQRVGLGHFHPQVTGMQAHATAYGGKYAQPIP